MFKILLDNIIEGESLVTGRIYINDFDELLEIPLSYWEVSDYKAHWKESINRIVNKDETKSALITEMYDPDTANFIVWWLLYREGDNIFIQNQVLFLNQIEGKFDKKNIYTSVPKREIKTDENEDISEWCIQLEDIKEFLENF